MYDINLIVIARLQGVSSEIVNYASEASDKRVFEKLLEASKLIDEAAKIIELDR